MLLDFLQFYQISNLLVLEYFYSTRVIYDHIMSTISDLKYSHTNP